MCRGYARGGPNLGRMGMWTDRVVPHLADRSLSTGPVMRLRERRSPGSRPGAGARLRQRPQRRALPGRGRPRSTRSSRRTSAGSLARRGRAPGCRSSGPGSTGSGWRRPTGSTTPCCRRSRCAPSPTSRGPWRRYAGCCVRAAPSTSSSTAARPRAGRALAGPPRPGPAAVAGGCHLSRDVPALVAGAGLEIVELEADYLPGPRSATRGAMCSWAGSVTPTTRRGLSPPPSGSASPTRSPVTVRSAPSRRRPPPAASSPSGSSRRWWCGSRGRPPVRARPRGP